jgi:hypothetical protein
MPFRNRLVGVHSTFTAIAKKDGDWWIGWIEEVPGVNAQEKTKKIDFLVTRDSL